MSTMICRSHLDDGSLDPAWLEERKKGVTATDAAKLLGGESALALWARKTGRIEPENLDKVERVWWGNHLESKIIEAYGSQRYANRKVEPSGELMRSDEHPWLQATLDARTEHPEHGLIPLEVKNTDRFMEDRWENGAPEIYLWQARTQAVVEDTVASSVACALGGNRLLWADDEQTTANVNRILEVTEKFWWHVTNDVPPEETDGRADTKKALDVIFSPESGTHVSLDASFTELDLEYAELVGEQKARNIVNKDIKERMTAIESKFKRAIGNHEQARLNTGVLWILKQMNRKEHMVRASSTNRLTRRAPR
jgi:putative phage-type endonuclease